MGIKIKNVFTFFLIAVVTCGTLATAVKPKPKQEKLPQKAKANGSPEAGNLTAQAVAFRCSTFNGKQLDTCCSTPIDDYFVKAQKTVCNGGKTDAGLFKITKEYVLNKNQNILNKLDLTVDVAKLGKPACFTECLFEKSELISEGVVAADAVSAYFAENLDETWAEIVSTASADCATAVETATETTSTVVMNVKPKVTKVCKLAPYLIMQCVLRTVGLACPADATSKTTACTTAIAGITKCDPFAVAEETAKL